ncbi:MAG: HNH endonuclease [Candidatus Thorarchaeota archaeon]
MSQYKGGKLYCGRHRHHLNRYGYILERTRFTPNDVIRYDDRVEIVLRNFYQQEVGKAIIDIEDLEIVRRLKWHMNDTGYVARNQKNRSKMELLHRFIMKASDQDPDIDHINRNPLDNRKSNLRFCSKSRNMFNIGIPTHNTSGVVGVCWSKREKKWSAYIERNGRRRSLGNFLLFEDAVQVRKDAELEHFGEVIQR